MFERSDNDIERKGFIDKNDILKFVSEEEIFELVFGFKPKEYDYVRSPFRKDKDAGCWFQYYPSGKLKFTDFGSQTYIKGRKMINIDCFDAVQLFFNLTNLYQTLKFIKKHLIDGKELPERVELSFIQRKRREVTILFDVRQYNSRDADYYKRYEISSQNLIDDKVFAVRKFKLLNTKFGDYSTTTYDLCYAHTDFEDGRMKLHRPHQKGKNRFITNCNQNDIYGINKLPEYGELLIITKSYKDWRVLTNQGLNVIGFQNEGMIPTGDILLPICKRFRHIIVFFDNDNTGIEAGIKVSNHINSYYPGKSRSIHLDITLAQQSITDPSDLIHKKGRETLIKFLKENKVL